MIETQKARRKCLLDFRKRSCQCRREILVKIHMRINPTSIYQIREKELMRESTKGRSKRQRCAVLEAEILKRILKYHFYRVLLTNDKNKKVTTWVPISDKNQSATHEKELEKKNIKKRRLIPHRKYFRDLNRRNIVFDFREEFFNPFSINVPFLYPLKTSEIRSFSEFSSETLSRLPQQKSPS